MRFYADLHMSAFDPTLLNDSQGLLPVRVKLCALIRTGFKCVEALRRIIIRPIIRGPYPPLNAIIYMQ